MSTALAIRETATPAVTTEQLELVKKTVAQGATADELKLYLYDCARQGVHPLDKLIHFTKRSGKYTPITSIDFMRIRAAETNEYAGSDDAVIEWGDKADFPLAAQVTVWRLVQGTRCPFTATARWAEYKPEQNDFMWKKMPATMLAKCAEALALRKGFPRQLAGLYAKEEMDQAGPSNGSSYSVEAPAPALSAIPPTVGKRENASGPSAGEPSGHLSPLPEGVTRITRVDGPNGRAKGFIHTSEHPFHGNGGGLALYDDRLATFATQCCQDGIPVRLTTKTSAAGKPYVTEIHRAESAALSVVAEPLGNGDIAF